MASLITMPEEAEEPFSFDSQEYNSTKVRRVTDREWESVKTEIEQLYIDQDQTLATTMQVIEKTHGLKASERKWKLKMKQWGFDKYLSTTAMKILVAKAERRAFVEKKDTVFLHGKKEIAPERIELFKTRRSFRQGPAASPSQKTPANIFYWTPCMNYRAGMTGAPDARISGRDSVKVITISEFRAHKQLIVAHHAMEMSAITNSAASQQYIDSDAGSKALCPAKLSNDQIGPNTPATESLYFKWKTLLQYVEHFCKLWAWSPEEIRVMRPELYSEVAETVAQEILAIAPSGGSDTYLLHADSNNPELPETSNNSTAALFTTHFHALFLDTNLAVALVAEDANFPPRMIATAYKMLDKFFRLELDPSVLQLDLGSLSLARILAARGKEEAAKECYHEALKSPMPMERGRLDIQLHFSKFLLKVKRQQEAIMTLVNEYTTYLSNHWPTPHCISCRAMPPMDYDVLKSLQSLHSMDLDGTFTGVRASLCRLLGIHLPEGSRMDDTEMVLLEFMRLGAAYSELCWLDTANSIYGIAAPRLEVCYSRTRAFERACVFSDFARYNEIWGSPEDRSKQLQLAFRCIQVVHLYDDQENDQDFWWVQMKNRRTPQLLQLPGEYPFFTGPPGPRERHFESLAKKDPLLSRWMLGETFESALASEMVL